MTMDYVQIFYGNPKDAFTISSLVYFLMFQHESEMSKVYNQPISNLKIQISMKKVPTFAFSNQGAGRKYTN